MHRSMPKELDLGTLQHGTELVKRGFAKMQKGGVIMDVTDAAQAAIAEEAGAVAVMALERVPADIRAEGGVSRMSDPSKIQEILDAVSIPVMAKCRIGHFGEAQILQSLGVDMIDESEVLTPADPYFHVHKADFTVPFVCGATNLGEAVRRIAEGAAMIRTKGEAGSGDIVEAMRHRRLVTRAVQIVTGMDNSHLNELADMYAARHLALNHEVLASMGVDSAAGQDIWAGRSMGDATTAVRKVLEEIKQRGRLPVVDFTAGGIATPADAALMMQMGSDGVFVGSGIFKSGEPERRARAIVEATLHFEDAAKVAQVSKDLGVPMVGRNMDEIEIRLAERGW